MERGSTGSRVEPGDAMEHVGPDVTITVGDITGEIPDERGFDVADAGPGIPPDGCDQVFEADHLTAPDDSGFGLNIVREITVAHR